MSPTGCNCNKNRATAAGGAAVSGTYVVQVNGRQVYESSSLDAAKTVAGRFETSEILGPDGNSVAK